MIFRHYWNGSKFWQVVWIEFFVFFAVVARFGDHERTVGVGNVNKFARVKEFVLKEGDVAYFG
jgi:hypothetical protein